MRASLLLFGKVHLVGILAAGVLAPPSVIAQEQSVPQNSISPRTASAETLVKELGSDDNEIDRMKALAQRPVEAAGLLVQELHPVSGGRILSQDQDKAEWKDTEHVIWCLHALRYLTGGLEFRATTNHHFGKGELEENRKWFVGGERFSKDGTVRFFGVWMSRDSLYIAPRDAQRVIVEEWRVWYRTKGTTFAYIDPNKEQDPDLWYF
ncbi:MAG: hypothetical protein ACLP56_12175 [Candidatus Sulfotelmatobacter sp.]